MSETEPFPPEPWDLRGRMHIGLRRVRPSRLPKWPLPEGVRPLDVGGRRLLLTFCVDYSPEGTLAYRELLVALAVRQGRRIGCTAVAVWVDSEQSKAGGRTLWGIPKEIGHFTWEPGAGPPGTEHVTLRAPGTGEVRAAFRPGRTLPRRLPVRLPIRTRLLQEVDGEVLAVPAHLTGRPAPARTSFRPDPAGELAFLGEGRPLLAFTLEDFRFRVGFRPPRERLG
ncbi:acetoacetate decarboxylase family protein [Streptomyces sp. NPDC056600]|uniref:acetoacetate decarboxylase family protein n=1 Tax=Streptomyces sp. NPDC056600 TaxID=3345874 RepID=UPI0036C5138B